MNPKRPTERATREAAIASIAGGRSFSANVSWHVNAFRPIPSRAAVLASCLLACAGCAGAPRFETPACENPVEVTGKYDRRAQAMYTMLPSFELAAAVARDHELPPPSEGVAILRVPTTIEPRRLAELRCDKRIGWLEYDTYLPNVTL